MRGNRRRRGQTVMESALAVLCFALLLFGMVDCGALVLEKNFVSWAAGEGARYAMVRGASAKAPATGESVSSFVKKLAVAIPRPDALSVTTTWPAGNGPGRMVRVSVRCLYRPMTTLALPESISLSGTSETIIRQ
ncbi:MAG: TadE/TadG family type IV pilus assembly protein [Bryobacteraceae bacterium]